MDRRLSIAQVNAHAAGGGAERIARQLMRAYRERGHRSWLIVGRGAADGDDVLAFPRTGSTGLAHLLAGPLRILDRHRGLETYRYPATRHMLDVLPGEPDILHLHNLHGGYFDLRALSGLGRRRPVVMTLHDAWLLSGHCAHSIDCDRWRTGCGACPDLGLYPAVTRDATARNWERKRAIFAGARLHVATPSQWLADRVRDSILAPAVAELRVIHNGVELDVFTPGDAGAARRTSGLPHDALIVLTVGSGGSANPYKDLATARHATAHAAEMLNTDVVFLVLGDDGPDQQSGRLTERHVPFTDDLQRVADYYRACDVFVHAARADTFPTTVLEALACGRPSAATAVGGIPEQIRSHAAEWTATAANGERDDATGVLVPPGDAAALGRVIARLLDDTDLRLRLGRNAARDARQRFDARRQADTYLEWYRAILGRSDSPPPLPRHGGDPGSGSGRR
jgi:glycosyltransferase involved in cell wall biosynthesis